MSPFGHRRRCLTEEYQYRTFFKSGAYTSPCVVLTASHRDNRRKYAPPHPLVIQALQRRRVVVASERMFS